VPGALVSVSDVTVGVSGVGGVWVSAWWVWVVYWWVWVGMVSVRCI